MDDHEYNRVNRCKGTIAYSAYMTIHNNTQFRSATNTDALRVRELVFSILHEYGLTEDTSDTDSDLLDIEQSYHTPGGMFDVLVTDEGEIIACVGLYVMREGCCELRKMYLEPAWRGRGLGRRLLDHALARARGLGFNRVELETAGVLKEAITLYESYGFQPIRNTHVCSRCDQAYALDLGPVDES